MSLMSVKTYSHSEAITFIRRQQIYAISKRGETRKNILKAIICLLVVFLDLFLPSPYGLNLYFSMCFLSPLQSGETLISACFGSDFTRIGKG